VPASETTSVAARPPRLRGAGYESLADEFAAAVKPTARQLQLSRSR